jgi:chitinase
LTLLSSTNPRFWGLGTYSSNFAQPASTPAGRAQFASSAVSLIKDYGFDGLDIDWEYPKSQLEASHFVLLLQACREAMDAYSSSLPKPHHFELTVACPAGPQNYKIMDITSMDKYLDFWNLMAYDYAGSWDSAAGHQANLKPSKGNSGATPFNTEDAVEHYRRQSVAASKIVLGMPLYGRAFENTDGLGKQFSGVGEGSWESGVFDYKALPLPGAEERYDEEARATYSYDPARRHLVTYDTPWMARKKAEWIKRHGLGGAMWWESSGDKKGEQSLIGNVVGILGPMEQTKNCLDYPQSKFGNLRDGIWG